MKFLATILIISSVLGQSARVFHDRRGNQGTNYRKYRCFTNLNNVGWGVDAERYVNVEFYTNSNCRGNWRRSAYGRVKFNDSINYQSIKLTYRQEDEARVNALDSSDSESASGSYEDQ